MPWTLLDNPLSGLYTTDGEFDLAKAAATTAGAAGIYGLLNPDSRVGEFLGLGGSQQPVGYSAGIPEYSLSRSLQPDAFAQTTVDPVTGETVARRPGSMGRRYFTDTTFTPTGGTLTGGQTPAATPADSGITSQIDTETLAALAAALGGIFGGGAGTTQEDYTEGLATDASTQAAVNEALAGTGTTITGGTDTTTTGGADTTTDTITDTITDTTTDITDIVADTGTADTDYNNFIGNYLNTTLTAEDATALANSGYAIDRMAASLKVDPNELREFINYYTSESANSTPDEPLEDLNPPGTERRTAAQLKQAVLDGTMSYSDALGWLNIADDPNPFGFTEEEQMALGIHESQRTGRGYKYNEATGSMDLYDYDTDTFVDTAFEDYVSNYKNTTLTKDDLLSLANSGYDLGQIAAELDVDVDELNYHIGRAQTQDVLDSVDPTDGFSTEEQDAVAQLLTEGKIGLGDITEQYDLDTMDAIEGVLRGGYETPAEMVARLAPYNEGLTEEELIITLLREGRTTPAEVASYYGVDEALVRERAGLAGGGYLGGKGYYLGGSTDGMADKIPATINNIEPARLSDGEFVIPADVVSHLGNGNSDAGAKNLYAMMERVRKDRTGNPNQGRQIDPNKYLA